MSTTIGSYKVIDWLGAGPLGDTHRARDTRRGRTVALTLVSPAIALDPKAKAAFLEAVGVASKLSHPHIATIWEVGEHDGRLFVSSEWVAGKTLAALLGGGALGVRRAVEIGVQIAEALAEGAAHGLVHRDLRPENVLVTDRGQVKLLHFGLAAFTASEADLQPGSPASDMPSKGTAGPSPDPLAYASPEQVLGGRTDHRSDLFALGIILHQMLTGRHPFAGSTPSETAVKIMQSAPPPLRQAVPDLPPELDPIVNRLLAKSLDGRYQTASAVAAELRALDAMLDERLDRRERVAAAGRRLRRGLLVALLVTVIAGGVAAWYLFGRAAQAPPPVARGTLAPTLVVIPFEPAGGDRARAYVANGFSSDLIVRLGRMPGIRVVGRSAARLDDRGTPEELARRLGASAALTGTVVSTAGRIVINVSLIGASDGAVVLNRRFESGAAGALVLQEQIVDAVLAKVAVPAGGRVQIRRARRADSVSYDLLLQGRDAAERRDRARAIALYGQAIAAQQDLAEAHVGLAEAIHLESFYGGSGAEQAVLDRARAAADTAGKLDPDLPTAHLVRGLTAGTLTEALAALTEATRLDLGYGEAFHQIGDQILEIDPGKALGFYQHSLQLDPGLDSSYRDIASAEAALGRAGEAAAAIASGRKARPDWPWWSHLEARFDVEAGRFDAAMNLLSQDAAAESLPAIWLMGRVTPLALSGRGAEARQSASRLVARHPWFCDGRTAQAGLALEVGTRREKATAREELDRLIGEGSGPTASPDDRLCGASAAAALGDARRTGSLVAAIAADEPSLRLWIRQSTVSPNLAFRGGWYPWSKVIGQPGIAEATRALAAAIDRLRASVANLQDQPR